MQPSTVETYNASSNTYNSQLHNTVH